VRAAVLVLQILLLLTLAVFGNFLHYSIKMFLRLKGFEVSFWRNDPINMINSLRKFIGSEQDLRTKSQYRKVLYLYIASIALFIVGGLSFVFAGI